MYSHNRALCEVCDSSAGACTRARAHVGLALGAFCACDRSSLDWILQNAHARLTVPLPIKGPAPVRSSTLACATYIVTSARY